MLLVACLMGAVSVLFSSCKVAEYDTIVYQAGYPNAHQSIRVEISNDAAVFSKTNDEGEHETLFEVKPEDLEELHNTLNHIDYIWGTNPAKVNADLRASDMDTLALKNFQTKILFLKDGLPVRKLQWYDSPNKNTDAFNTKIKQILTPDMNYQLSIIRKPR